MGRDGEGDWVIGVAVNTENRQTPRGQRLACELADFTDEVLRDSGRSATEAEVAAWLDEFEALHADRLLVR